MKTGDAEDALLFTEQEKATAVLKASEKIPPYTEAINWQKCQILDPKKRPHILAESARCRMWERLPVSSFGGALNLRF